MNEFFLDFMEFQLPKLHQILTISNHNSHKKVIFGIVCFTRFLLVVFA